jgi:hypothetical protein
MEGRCLVSGNDLDLAISIGIAFAVNRRSQHWHAAFRDGAISP